MTNKEAAIKLFNIMHDDFFSWTAENVEAFKMAVDALNVHDPSKDARTDKSGQERTGADLISRQAAIDALGEEPYVWDDNDEYTCGERAMWKMSFDAIRALPSAQPEQVHNNSIHLCDSCQYSFPSCLANAEDVLFGNGKGNDNICACNKYNPQPKRGRWIEENDGWDGIFWRCSECGEPYTLMDGRPSDNKYNFCPNCGTDMREGEQDETD